jgi:predicted small lipoprotein YifL
MKAKSLILSITLAGVALAGCGRLGELQRPGPGGPEPRAASTRTVMDPAIDRRTPAEAPIPGSNPH